jgi:hypothetical protein
MRWPRGSANGEHGDWHFPLRPLRLRPLAIPSNIDRPARRFTPFLRSLILDAPLSALATERNGGRVLSLSSGHHLREYFEALRIVNRTKLGKVPLQIGSASY